MPGKVGSASFAVFLVDGVNLLAMKVQNVTHKIEALHENGRGLGDPFDATLPTGIARGTFTQDGGFFDDSANGAHLAFSGPTSPIRILTVAPFGNAIGAPMVGAQGIYDQDYSVIADNGKITKANVTYAVAGALERGVIVQNWTQKTVTWNTKTDGSPVDFTLDRSQRVIPITSNSIANPTVVTTAVPHGRATGDVVLISGVTGSTPTINGAQTITVIDATHFSVPVNVTVAGTGGTFVLASTANGAAGYLEVSEMTGPTGFVGKVRHSPDDITYADLVTFANVTAAPTAQRVTAAGAVGRYLSFSGTITGAGTLTVFSGLGRNP